MLEKFDNIFLQSEREIYELTNSHFRAVMGKLDEQKEKQLNDEYSGKIKALRATSHDEAKLVLQELSREELLNIAAMFCRVTYQRKVLLEIMEEERLSHKDNAATSHRGRVRAKEREILLQHQLWNVSSYAEQARTARRKGALERHAENRAMKQDVFHWLQGNFLNFKSMDSAAEHIAAKVALVKFRTARDWVGQWKKLQSAIEILIIHDITTA